MLQHLLTLEAEPLSEAASVFVPADRADPADILNGKIATDQWLQSLGIETPPAPDTPYEHTLAAQAFALATSNNDVPIDIARERVMALKTAESVRKAEAMLDAYEWSFVERADKIRGYIVAGLLDETKNTKAEVRLKAFKMLGEVTEVALFTQRTEVVTKNLSDEQIEEEINRRLERLTVNSDTPLVTRVNSEVDDVEDVDDA